MLIYIIIVLSALILFFILKSAIWDKAQNQIQQLKQDKVKLQKALENQIYQLQKDNELLKKKHHDEIEKLRQRVNNGEDLHINGLEFSDIVTAYAWRELAELSNRQYSFLDIPKAYSSVVSKNGKIIDLIKQRFESAITEQYKYQYLTYLYPELANVFCGDKVIKNKRETLANVDERTENLFDVVNTLRSNSDARELILLKNRVSFLESSTSNLKAIPYMAGIMADYETYGIENLAKELDWGYAAKRLDKVKSIREIRKDAQAMVEKNKEAQYQLSYLLSMYPVLEDVIETEFNELPVVEVSELSNYDSARDYLSKDEYSNLNETERNQLALDRYKNSHKKSNWQIGRDYEAYVGYKYNQKGYDIDPFGSYMGMEDLGRDIIAKKDGRVLIIQCKYWSKTKEIHENHINQLYGTMICYCLENNIDKSMVKGILITNITLSDMAKKMAKYLGIEYVENFQSADYPCIKCNLGRGEYGEETKIYHLPFDQQYDSVKINKAGEFYAMTVQEAEAAGFRRAYKWYGAN
jgi:HJR/Mrr/RecB family endonuclease